MMKIQEMFRKKLKINQNFKENSEEIPEIIVNKGKILE